MRPGVPTSQNRINATSGATQQDLKSYLPSITGTKSVTFVIYNDGTGDAYLLVDGGAAGTLSGTRFPASSERELGPIYLPVDDDKLTIDAQVGADLYVDVYIHG